MPRKLRVEYPGAMYHVMSRGDRREDIFLDDVDRQDFLKTLAEACQKTGWQVHAYCLMRNHYHLVLETPNANLVAGMAWLQSTYTIRLNHRHQLFGHVFSGRYKAQLVEGSGNGYLRTACDYVHLNPVRAGMLRAEERLLAYPWSSFGRTWPRRSTGRPGFGWTGCWASTASSRTRRRAGSSSSGGWKRGGWRRRIRRPSRCFGEAGVWAARASGGRCCGEMEGKLGEHHSGELHRESAEAKAERIIAEELQRLGWQEADLGVRRKNDAGKLALAARLRRETTLSTKAIAARVHLGSSKAANRSLHSYMRGGAVASAGQGQLRI